MFNISDIFDKYKKAKTPKAEEPKSEEVSVSSVVSRKLEEKNAGASLQLYEHSYRKIKDLYTGLSEGRLRSVSDMQRLSQELMEAMQQEDSGFLKICFSDYPAMEDYLYYHVLNVCIISLKLTSGLGFDRVKKEELALSCLLHDIGLVKDLAIISKPRALTKEEYATVRLHPQSGCEILNRVEPKLSSAVLEAVSQEHERWDGSGYPRGLIENEIVVNARIIGLADCFEALTHPRPHRKKFTSVEACKIVVDEKSSFEARLIKALFEKIGIFPVGTPVRLNTKELGTVLKTNEGSPLRPVVKVFYDVDGKELKEPKLLDLSQSKVLFISENI
ncbi:MAG: hypothetical protein AMJ95_02730 [Omnitrophica WOR_2 bacterium SM23_72]|nr:MAG: hypothetical protein AMJ95_02730 [Omnitrophica WOR_2 bacterium SM23_72]